MKHILLLFAVWLFYSCTDTGKDVPVNYQISRRINNASGVDVQISSYVNSLHGSEMKKYIVENGEEYIENGAFLIPENVGGGVPETEIEWTGSIDSTIVIFNELKFQLHCSDLSIDGSTTYDRSIVLGLVGTSLKNRGYELVKAQGNYREYLYTITKEDYENAEDCNGSCD